MLAQAVKAARQTAAAQALSPGGLQASRSALELRKPLLRPVSGGKRGVFGCKRRCGVEPAAARRDVIISP